MSSVYCKAKFLLETETHCIDDEDKVQSVTDTDNEFTECQTPRKKLQSIGISPVSLHAKFDSESDSYDKNDMKEKAIEFVKLHEAMEEKLKTASYSEQIQILNLVPDK